MAQRIDGKVISEQVRAEISTETAAWAERKGIRPGLAVIIVGSDPASCVYVRNKERACEQVGFYSEKYELPEAYDMTTETVVAKVMWALPKSRTAAEFANFFYTPVGNDMI